MGKVYSWVTAVGKALQSNHPKATAFGLFSSLAYLFLDILLYRAGKAPHGLFNPWVGRAVLNFLSQWAPDLFFYIEPTIVKKSRRKKIVSPRGSFRALKANLGGLPLEDLEVALVPLSTLAGHGHYLERTLLCAYGLQRFFCGSLAHLHCNLELGYPLTKAELLALNIAQLCTPLNVASPQLRWVLPSHAQTYSRALYRSSTSMAFNSSRNADCLSGPALGGAIPSKAPKHGSSLLRGRFEGQPVIRAASSQLEHLPTPEYKLVALTNTGVNAKGYTMRSRQFYRTGVIWCLGLTLFTLLGPYYLFYGFSFVFGYYCLFMLFLGLRFVIVGLWRLVPYVRRLTLWVRSRFWWL